MLITFHSLKTLSWWRILYHRLMAGMSWSMCDRYAKSRGSLLQKLMSSFEI